MLRGRLRISTGGVYIYIWRICTWDKKSLFCEGGTLEGMNIHAMRVCDTCESARTCEHHILLRS